MSASRAYTDGRNRKNKYSGGQEFPALTSREKRKNKERFLYNGGKKGKELL